MQTYGRHKRLYYILCDWLAAFLSWAVFFIFRKVGEGFGISDALSLAVADGIFWVGLLIIPLCWLLLYAVMGSYRRVLRKARLHELGQTLLATTIGCIVIFFACMLDDTVPYNAYYYFDFLFFFGVQFVLTYFCRLVLTSRTVGMVHRRQLGFPTLMVGDGPMAYKTYTDLENQEIYSGNSFVGFVEVGDCHDARVQNVMPRLGTLDNVRQLVESHQVEEVVVALEDSEQHRVNEILRILATCGDIIIKIAPNSRDILVGNVKIDNIFHSPLLVINNRLMPEWQYSIKRMFDIVVSLLVMLLLSPVYLITAIIVKTTSPGPVFYSQERVGYMGRPFRMIKFRSMYVDAESAGPALSKDDDPRITPFGRFMRKVRLDEFPQFYNVLKGNMSIVGPRPERQYYIDQIVQRAPEYLLLQRLRPGITSWGQVKYGYASTVDEMVERLRYDLLYIDNMSLATDIKIMLYTVIIICQGRGK